MNNYDKACTEVCEILSYLNKDEYEKIPSNVIKAIEKSKSREYVFKINVNMKLKEQKLLEETKAILFNLYRDYLANPQQREEIIEMQNRERQKLEIEKRLKYNPDKIFKKNDSENLDDKTVLKDDSTNLAKIKKENIIVKILNKIKKLLK